MDEEPLAGGFVNDVVRIDDTVRRPVGERAGFVHALLRWLEEQGWAGAPRILGFDERGREILSFIYGQAGWEPALRAAVSSEVALVRVARLLRELHDSTAGTALAGEAEVVCHNDLSPGTRCIEIGAMGGCRWRSSTGTLRRPVSASTTWRICAGSTWTSAQR